MRVWDWCQAGHIKNREYLSGKIVFAPEVDPNTKDLLFSPETAGGLLISVDRSKAGQLMEALRQEGCFFSPVGQIREKGFQPIRVVNGVA
jgi:selenide,water dikinase